MLLTVLTGKSNVLGLKTVSVQICSLQIAQGLRSNLGLRCEQLAAKNLSNGTTLSWVLYFSFNACYVKCLKCALQTDFSL